MANIRRRQNITGGSMHSFNLLDDQLSKFVGFDVRWELETDTVETDENNRQS